MVAGFLVLLLLLLAVFAGLVVAWAGIRGRPTLSEPTCRACGHDLRGVALEGGGACSECGADLSKRHAVQYGRMERRPVLVGVGCLVALLPLGIFPVLLFAPMRMGGPVAVAATQPTTQLAGTLAGTLEDPQVAMELERRYRGGMMSPAERDAVVDAVVTGIEALVPRADEPLHWSGTLVGAILADTAVDDARKQRIIDAYYDGAPAVDARERVARSGDSAFEVAGGRTWQLPGFGQMSTITAARLDGESIDPTTLVPRADALSAIAPFDLSGRLPTDLPPGERVLELDLEIGLFPDARAGGPPTLGGDGSARSRARELTHRWSETITIRYEVLPEGESPVTLVVGNGADPATLRAALRPRALVAEMRGGRPRLRIELDAGPTGAVALAFDVVVRCEAGEFTLGGFSRSLDGSTRSSALSTRLAAPLPPEIDVATVVLRPSLKRAERVPSIEAIWGEDVVFENVPIRRDDLADAGG